MIGSPVFYRNSEKNNSPFFVCYSQNAISHLPEPDFSMPFNIITYVCVVCGFYYLNMFKFACTKTELEADKKSFLTKILEKFKSFLS